MDQQEERKVVESSVGETALIVHVPEAEPLVRRWREREIGVKAHVTVLVPFLHMTLIDEGVRGELRRLFAGHPAIDVRFRRIERFPEVVYLAPEPADPFVRLTEAVLARWPEAPPYGGLHDEIVPHLTVGLEGAVDEAVVTAALPVVSRVTAVSLLVCEDGDQWTQTDVFPLA